MNNNKYNVYKNVGSLRLIRLYKIAHLLYGILGNSSVHGFVPFDFQRHRPLACLLSLSLSFAFSHSLILSLSYTLVLSLSLYIWIRTYTRPRGSRAHANPMFPARRRLAGLPRVHAWDRKAYINIHSAKFSRRISCSPPSTDVWGSETSSGRRRGEPTLPASQIAWSYG